ncbi:MAG: AAA family ATPase [Alphaproteobacteria bacterium]|nr:AAA family ATPase [Alphaproteobacteria bacterium]
MSGRARIIVLGNEKGGTGKSTVSMHLIVHLLHQGVKVGSIDLDARQATLTRYVENRRNRSPGLALPDHEPVPPTADRAADEARLLAVLDRLAGACEVVVIDTPGSDSPLSRLGHSFADTLVTPINDSFVDLDVLARVEAGGSLRITRLSHYAEMIWETKKQRALRGERGAVDWIVLRNRLSHVDARNKREVEAVLNTLAKRLAFRMVAGLGERVIYRELFLDGLTLFDLGRENGGGEMTLSHVAARQELRQLIEAVGIGG